MAYVTWCLHNSTHTSYIVLRYFFEPWGKLEAIRSWIFKMAGRFDVLNLWILWPPLARSLALTIDRVLPFFRLGWASEGFFVRGLVASSFKVHLFKNQAMIFLSGNEMLVFFFGFFYTQYLNLLFFVRGFRSWTSFFQSDIFLFWTPARRGNSVSWMQTHISWGSDILIRGTFWHVRGVSGKN